MSSDGRLYVTSVLDGTVSESREGIVLASHLLGGGPSGIAIASDGTVYVVQCSGLFGAPSDRPAGLYTISDGTVSALQNLPLRAPNDICFGPDGDLYLTDPVADPEPNGPVKGLLYAYRPDSGELRVVGGELLFPNGLAFEPGGDSLLVAESCTGLIHRFPWAAGKLGAGRVACTIADGPPDGMAVDQDGNIWVAVPPADAVEVFDRQGTLIDRVDCGHDSFPTNCCFGGADDGTLFITVAKLGGVLSVRPGVRGSALYS